MALSKKKSKNIAKAKARTSDKAKARVKKANQIQAGNKIKASKRSAAALSSSGNDDKLAGIDSVDDLFQSDIFEGDAEDDVDNGLAREDASDAGSEDSSAGAFCDVDGGGDDDDEGLPPDLEALGAGAAHEQELLAIKKSDPAFYKFLVENDKQLLDFRAPDEEDDEEDGGDDKEKQKKKAKEKAAQENAARMVTMERMKTIQDNAFSSFTAFKAALTAYHAAIRSIEGGVGAAVGENADEAEEQEQPARGSRSKRRRKKAHESLMKINDEAVFSNVIEWTLTNIVDLLQKHGGEQQGGAAGSRPRKKQRKGEKDAAWAEGEDGEEMMIDPTKYSRWNRVKVMASIFWDETYFLLTHLVAPEMLEFVLRQISSRQALTWLWPFRGVRRKFFARCCNLWSGVGGAGTHTVRVLGFLHIRNAAAMATVAPKGDKPLKKDQTELEAMVRHVLRSFADAASGGYSWRSVSTFRFMENCYLELLRLDDATAYRVGYVCIRQLALILRSACIATSQGTSQKSGANQDKARKKKNLHQQQMQTLVSWQFVRALHLWTKAVSSLPCMRPLAYPLATITTGALKSKLTSVQYYPFVYQCVRCLNRLSASIQVFVPVSSHLLKALSILLPAMDKAHRERKGGSGRERKGGNEEAGELLAKAKAPEIDILLRFTEGQTNEVMAMEAIGGSLMFLLTDHLGILGRSPSFPEISTPVVFHLRKLSKHCRSENLRRQLKNLITSVETTQGDITSRREQLNEKEVTSWKKFFIFEADSAIGKARAEILARKEREERQRVEAETRPDGKTSTLGPDDPEADEPQDGAVKGKDRKDRKREKQRDRLKRKAQEKDDEAKDALKKPGALPGKAKDDVVEEMGFSSGDEDSD